MYAILGEKGGIILQEVLRNIGIYVNKTVSQNPDSMISLHATTFMNCIFCSPVSAAILSDIKYTMCHPATL